MDKENIMFQSIRGQDVIKLEILADLENMRVYLQVLANVLI
jgi:hypothetical protein